MSRTTVALVSCLSSATALNVNTAGFQARHFARSVPQMIAEGDSALIIQNKGGGHGEIGYHLALQLAKEQGLKVTILHEGPNKGKPPHNAYGDLEDAGVVVMWVDSPADASSAAKLDGSSYSVVIDNWSKSPEDITPYAELAKAWGVEQYAYVSSAGMYTPEAGDDGPVTEVCAVKSSGQRQAEVLLGEMGLPYTCFRPQYIYGPNQGKSYLAGFFDRITRGKPVCVPNGGEQFVTMTHAADNAAMIAASIGKPAAVGEVFNCATSKLITYNDLVKCCASAAGVDDVKIVHYDPKKVTEGVPKGFFPFRDTAFYVSVDKAAKLLGFEPKFSIEEDAKWYFEKNYKAVGALDKEVEFSTDEKVLASI